jgi:Mg2+/Co2+ transporter CorB
MTILLLIVIISLILISSYCSANETAMTAASRAKIHQLSKEGNKQASIIKKLQEEVGLVISGLLLSNTILNTAVAFLFSTLFQEVFGDLSLWQDILLSFLVGSILVLSAEISPKIVAIHNPEKILLNAASILQVYIKLVKPLTQAFNVISRVALRLIGFKVRSNVGSHTSIEELRGVIDMHQGPGQDVVHERAMLKSILDLGSVQLDDIMIHRKSVSMICADDSPSDIVEQILSSPFTRIPLWRQDQDNIVGVINSKALLRAVHSHKGDLDQLDILSIASKPWFVPTNTDLLDQLRAFRERREHLCLVVDEYGSFMGIVTLEDVLEEIVGDISDEHDIIVKGVRKQDDGSFVIDGSVTLRDLNREYEWDLEDDEAATLAGYIIHHARLIPSVGQTFSIGHYRFEILRRQRNQLTLIKVVPQEEQKG